MESANPPQVKKGIPQMMNDELNSNPNTNSNPKIVVIMGATGSGKSKLAIDLAAHFPVEIINADSMQVYQGLDVLTNKVSIEDQKGVPHHLLGTISPNVEFTAKDFRDHAIPLISEICSRNRLPVIVGGTNYYIQALVSQFLLDDYAEDQEDYSFNLPGDKKPDCDLDLECICENGDSTYSRLKDLDPVAANRIHPNDHRKINQYLSLYMRSGVRPSELFQGNIMENWGRPNNFRYNCCFICLDATLPALDQYVDQRVDCMINAGLLNEVVDIYKLNTDYTRGLRQAIGVREFEDFLRFCTSECQIPCDTTVSSQISNAKPFKDSIRQIMDSPDENHHQILLTEAIDKMKLNTRRLVRRQRRRLGRMQMLFGWKLHCVNVTGCLLSASHDLWVTVVVEPSVKIIKSFLDNNDMEEARSDPEVIKLAQRNLWTQYTCQACGNKVLRGGHEWEQHKQGRSHRKRVSRLKKSGIRIELPHESTMQQF